MEEEKLVTVKAVSRQFNIPEYAIYRMVKDGRLPAHEMPREPWHKRTRIGFRLSEVERALSRSDHS